MKPTKTCPYCNNPNISWATNCEWCNYEFKDIRLFNVPQNTKMLKIKYSDGSIPVAICYNLNITPDILYIELWDKYNNEIKITKFVELTDGRYVRILEEIQNLGIEVTEQYRNDIRTLTLVGGHCLIITFIGSNNEELSNLSNEFISGKKIDLILHAKKSGKCNIEWEIKRIIPELDSAVAEIRSKIIEKYNSENNYSDNYKEESYSLWDKLKSILKKNL